MQRALAAVGVAAVATVVVAAQSRETAQLVMSQAVAQTKLFECGQDQQLEFRIPLRWETVVLAADGRGFAPCGDDVHTMQHREVREILLIGDARTSREPELRRIGILSSGRLPFGGRSLPGELLGRLNDPSPRVRQAAAHAIGEALRPVPREPSGSYQAALQSGRPPQPEAAAVANAARRLELRLAQETDDIVAATLLTTLGGLQYEDDGLRSRVEALLASRITEVGSARLMLGAVRGLEALWRRNPRFDASGAALERMRAAATHTSSELPVTEDAPVGETLGDASVLAQARRVAILALARSGLDETTALRAARDLDWQVRRVAVAAMSPAPGPSADALDRALSDSAFQVRLEAVRVLGRYAVESGNCQPLIAALDDRSPLVVMAALDALTSMCDRQDEWLPQVVGLSAVLERAESWTAWHVPARALAALARVRPEPPAMLGVAAEHPAWQVRAVVAEVSRTLGLQRIALGLVDDRHPNVRAFALGVLRDLDSPARFEPALAALRSEDFNLMRMAAEALAGAPDRDIVAAALMQRLNELAADAWDTSRTTRVAMVERLGAMLAPQQASSLQRYMNDFDPAISVAASRAFMLLTGTQAWPAASRLRRYPYQPGLDAIATLPRHATIRIEGGSVVELELLPDIAPVTIARFAELVEARYYDGLTFYRVDPNFAVHAGSPGENEYSSISRFIRDEVGAPHVRGAVAIATHGRDTGDGRFFINLVDNPNLDGDYTVFARVIAGMREVDAILPGARIEAISVR